MGPYAESIGRRARVGPLWAALLLTVVLPGVVGACGASSRAGAAASTTSTAPASSARVSCPAVTRGNDGTIAPLQCSNGTDEPAALAYYERAVFDPTVLHLRSSATRSRVLTAICADLEARMSVPTEQQAYQLAANRDGWDYGIVIIRVDADC